MDKCINQNELQPVLVYIVTTGNFFQINRIAIGVCYFHLRRTNLYPETVFKCIKMP